MSGFILASASPRRQQLLSYLDLNFSVQSADIDESAYLSESPEKLVARLAEAKARAVHENSKNYVVLGSDTVVAKDQHILGKPRDKNDFIGMMQLLSGVWHQVYTGVSLVSNSFVDTIIVITEVEFTRLSESDISKYWLTGEPIDKAGGYAIQGIGGQFVKQVKGSVSAVIGLPLAETKLLLKRNGII